MIQWTFNNKPLAWVLQLLGFNVVRTSPVQVSLAPLEAAIEALLADGERPSRNHVLVAAHAWNALAEARRRQN